jgi:hypothetical protein
MYIALYVKCHEDEALLRVYILQRVHIYLMLTCIYNYAVQVL